MCPRGNRPAAPRSRFLKIIQSDLINAGVSIAVDIVELEGAEHGPVHKFFTGLYM